MRKMRKMIRMKKWIKQKEKNRRKLERCRETN